MSKELVKDPLKGILSPVAGSNLPVIQPGQSQVGLEAMEEGDISMPRLAICQSLSPQRDETKPQFIEGLKEGDLFNTLTGVIYPKQVHVVPLRFWKSRLLFDRLEKGGGMLCTSPDAKTGGQLCETCEKCPHSQWGADNGQKPACLLIHNFLCLMLPSMEPVVISMKSASLKVAKAWGGQLRLLNRPICTAAFSVEVARDQNKLGRWFNWRIRGAGWLNDEALIKQASEFQAAVSGKTITVEVEHPETEREPGDDSI